MYRNLGWAIAELLPPLGFKGPERENLPEPETRGLFKAQRVERSSLLPKKDTANLRLPSKRGTRGTNP